MLAITYDYITNYFADLYKLLKKVYLAVLILQYYLISMV